MIKEFVALVAFACSISGCSTMAVNADNLESKTAFALGLEANEFTISDRVDNGVRTDYSVTTKTGTKYRCYVTGVVTIVGKSVSDAICGKKGEPLNNQLTN